MNVKYLEKIPNFADVQAESCEITARTLALEQSTSPSERTLISLPLDFLFKYGFGIIPLLRCVKYPASVLDGQRIWMLFHLPT